MSEPRADLLSFIRSSIRSVWALEVLLLLRRARDRSFSAEELVRELRASPRVVADALATFRQAGLVLEETQGVRYRPARPELDALATELETAYMTRPTLVIDAILGGPGERLQAFADAFRLKKD